jgi:hypothetical protein
MNVSTPERASLDDNSIFHLPFSIHFPFKEPRKR